MMHEIAVGKPFPVPAGRGAGIIPVLNGESFDIYGWVEQPSYAEKLDWKQGEIRYGLYIEDDIPFLLFRIGAAWSFDVSINIMSETNERGWGFLNGAGNAISLFLVDYPSNVVQAIRMIGADHLFMQAIRATLERQANRYEVSGDVDVTMEAIIVQRSFEEMWEQATKYSLSAQRN